MITYLHSTLFSSPAQTLVNTVNTEGVMGKGIAKQFKSRFPKMFLEYKKLCDDKRLGIGNLHLWRGDTTWVLNFPTKVTWRQPSRLTYIEAGLDKFVETYRSLGVVSAAFPPLGCGNGGLDWNEVRPLMERYLKRVNIPVYIHNVHVSEEFVPEHREFLQPASFDAFWHDIAALVKSADKPFKTSTPSEYQVLALENKSLMLHFKHGKSQTVPTEILEEAFVQLRNGVLLGANLPDENTRKLKSYLFPILARLPYVTEARASQSNERNQSRALFFNKNRQPGTVPTQGQQGEQGCLSL